jgi:hypothetical protein
MPLSKWVSGDHPVPYLRGQPSHHRYKELLRDGCWVLDVEGSDVLCPGEQVLSNLALEQLRVVSGGYAASSWRRQVPMSVIVPMRQVILGVSSVDGSAAVTTT